MRESVIDDPTSGCSGKWEKITYNPYLHKSFVLESDESIKVP